MPLTSTSTAAVSVRGRALLLVHASGALTSHLSALAHSLAACTPSPRPPLASPPPPLPPLPPPGGSQETYGIPASRVILYGQSVGSGPSVWLASERPDVAGVVLHSPLLSGVRVLKPHVRWWPAWADVYPNHVLAPKVKSPVLVMHVRSRRGTGGGAMMGR